MNSPNNNTSASKMGGVPAFRQKRVISPAEKNRLKTEVEFLSLCAQNPGMASDFYHVLGQTAWHDSVHEKLAQILLEIFSTNASLTVPEVLTKADAVDASASKILTSATIQGHGSAYDSLKFLSEELSIGDLEQDIAKMRDQLKNDYHMSSEEQSVYFQSIAALQNDLNALKAAHFAEE